MSYNNKILEDSDSIADGFSSFFESSFVKSSEKSVMQTDIFPNQCPINLQKFTEQVVLSVLKKLKSKPTVGLDKIPAFLIKDCAIIFSRPLMTLFNLSLDTSTFPEQWKISRITPVFKKGDKNCVTNYRPISIINNFSKVFEIILHEQLYNSFNRYITPHQHGFMKRRSTVTNLFCFTQDLAKSLDVGEQTDVIYTDCSKAFDKLDHGILLDKLSAPGTSSRLLALFHSYLMNRKKIVQCHGTNSREFVATSGVPQGSHLGPLLFNIFLNDLVHVLDVRYLLYADDVKIYLRINTRDDCVQLHQNFIKMNKWCKKINYFLTSQNAALSHLQNDYNQFISITISMVRHWLAVNLCVIWACCLIPNYPFVITLPNSHLNALDYWGLYAEIPKIFQVNIPLRCYLIVL